MSSCDLLIRNASIIDGTGAPAYEGDVSVRGSRIVAMGAGAQRLLHWTASTIVDAAGKTLAPGFIDAHTHDDLAVIRAPQMLAKLSQGVTSVVVGNCGISASPASVAHRFPDPMNLLGGSEEFCYRTFSAFADAVDSAVPAVNVAALVGHTTLRNQHMSALDRTASAEEIACMQTDLAASLDAGAIGLSSGLAYLSAFSATTDEVLALADTLRLHGGVYATHLRSETEKIRQALQEAFRIGRAAASSVVVSHLKCAGIDNWGRSVEVLDLLEDARRTQSVACDCYPYAAGSSTLDLRQVDERVTITITWSDPHPEIAGQNLAEIATAWNTSQLEAARLLMPAGAIYHSISEQDMQRILQHDATMIGSDGLPCDPRPHPRLWGSFPRVLGRYARDLGLFSMETAVHKMTAKTADYFGLIERGRLAVGCHADMVLFDPDAIMDRASFADPEQISAGIQAVWVNGVLSYQQQASTGRRAGRMLRRRANKEVQ